MVCLYIKLFKYIFSSLDLVVLLIPRLYNVCMRKNLLKS